jgi:hypothetical protein
MTFLKLAQANDLHTSAFVKPRIGRRNPRFSRRMTDKKIPRGDIELEFKEERKVKGNPHASIIDSI